jgi:hypothetical protein
MGTDSLISKEFFEDLSGIIIIGVKNDSTVNVRTNILNKEEYQSVITTALVMSSLEKDKFTDKRLDNLH